MLAYREGLPPHIDPINSVMQRMIFRAPFQGMNEKLGLVSSLKHVPAFKWLLYLSSVQKGKRQKKQ